MSRASINDGQVYGSLAFWKDLDALYATTPGVPIASTMAYVGSSAALEIDTGTGNGFVPLDCPESERFISD
jgi:hypothetical protein